MAGYLSHLWERPQCRDWARRAHETSHTALWQGKGSAPPIRAAYSPLSAYQATPNPAVYRVLSRSLPLVPLITSFSALRFSDAQSVTL